MRWQNWAFACCILFGLILIAETQLADDGGWYWYAVLLSGGQKLYSGMHLALQPLFVLETRAWLALLGKGWLLSRIPAVTHLLAYSFALYLLVRETPLRDAQRGILLLCVFLFSISFEVYKFDDYHVITECFELYSLLALLRLQRARKTKTLFALATILGILSGLSLATRLNDGGMLFAATLVGILCLAHMRKIALASVCVMVAGITATVVVLLTGDSFHDYATYSIFHSASSKGGVASILQYPLLLPGECLTWLRSEPHQHTLLYWIGATLIWAVVINPVARHFGRNAGILCFIVVFLVACWTGWIYFLFRSLFILTDVSAWLVLTVYAIAAYVIIRFMLALFGDERAWDRRQVLLLVPFVNLLSGSMSSGGYHVGLYAPLAEALLLVAICLPVSALPQWSKDILAASAMLLIVAAGAFKIMDPCSWQAYREKPLFTGRVWYHHPELGPMIIDKDLLQMIQPVCRSIGQTGQGQELLSLPLPYANRFCDIPPWHGFVQTFFDTSSPQIIDDLMAQLHKSPPRWIFYQREISILSKHEEVYNHGKPLEHRRLDGMILQEVEAGRWQVVYQSDFENDPGHDNHWYLIETR